MPIDTEISTTRALVCHAGQLVLEETRLPPLAATDLRIDVMALGLCRTDLYAISGRIKTSSTCFIPGHEFAGIVTMTGSQVQQFQIGDHVVVNPVRSCEICQDCGAGDSHLCAQTKFMGIDFDGACREQIVAPQHATYKIPRQLSFEAAAFAEPVAATLAVLKTDVRPSQRGLIIGSNRIAELARRVLTAYGFQRLEVAELDEASAMTNDQFDFAIETQATTDVFAEMVRLVRPRGKLILKSRQYRPFEITMREIINKEPQINIVNYGRFTEAVQLLSERTIEVDDLIGRKFALEQFSAAIAHASANTSQKTFLLPRNEN